MLEYPTLGRTLAGLPAYILEKRIEVEKKDDRRKDSRLYYDTFLAENLLSKGEDKQAIALFNTIISKARPKYDDALKLNAILLKLTTLDDLSPEYRKLAKKAFTMSRASLTNNGLRLPVNISLEGKSVIEELDGSAFMVDNSLEQEFIVSYSQVDDLHSLRFSSRSKLIPSVTVQGGELTDVINKFTDEVFRQKV
jgi:hypothetical protein